MQKQNLNPGLLISNTMLFTLQQEYTGVGGGGLSLCEGLKSVTIALFCMPETSKI